MLNKRPEELMLTLNDFTVRRCENQEHDKCDWLVVSKGCETIFGGPESNVKMILAALMQFFAEESTTLQTIPQENSKNE